MRRKDEVEIVSDRFWEKKLMKELNGRNWGKNKKKMWATEFEGKKLREYVSDRIWEEEIERQKEKGRIEMNKLKGFSQIRKDKLKED